MEELPKPPRSKSCTLENYSPFVAHILRNSALHTGVSDDQSNAQNLDPHLEAGLELHPIRNKNRTVQLV